MRIERNAGTAIGTIGLWDTTPQEPRWLSPKELEAEARAGRLFFIRTGVVDTGEQSIEDGASIRVDEPVAAAELEHYVTLGPWCLLRVPSGRLCFGGAEDYRAERRTFTDEGSEFDVLPGDYEVRAHTLDPDEFKAVREFLSESDFACWESAHRREDLAGCLFALGLVVSVGLWVKVSWMYGVVGTGASFAVLFLGYYLATSSRRFREIARRVDEAGIWPPDEQELDAFYEQHPCLLVELRRATGAATEGGWIG